MAITTDIQIYLNVRSPELITQFNRPLVRVIHERDHFTCRCCGFSSVKYQQILNPAGGWRDLDAISTACIFCQQCFSLDLADEMRSGVLITFPEMKQTDLNRLATEIYVARITQGAVADRARAALDKIINKSETTRAQLGTDNPGELARMLKDCKTKRERAVIEKKLKGVRLFPRDRRIIKEAELEFNQFPQILAYWRSKGGPFGQSLVNGVWILPRLERFAETYL